MRLHFLLLILLILAAAPAGASEQLFFSDLSDIPLMQGLYEVTDKAVIFDKPEGRIVEAVAVSESENVSNIKAFYDSALPQLGWVREAEGLFVRPGEGLRVVCGAEGKLSTVRLTVFPR